MTFLDFDKLEPEYVTPRYSQAFGPLVTGEQIEVGRLRFGNGGDHRPAQPRRRREHALQS